MAKIQILRNYNGENLPYFISESNIIHIDKELFVLTDSVKIDNEFGQLDCKKKDSVLLHIKSGLACFDFYRYSVKVNKLRLKNDTQNYVFELLKTYTVSDINKEKFFNAINKAEVINDITEIENSYFSKLENKKPIIQKLGKYKVSDNNLLSYNTELIHNSESKAIISEFKKWVKFVNEVALFDSYNAKLELLDNNEYLCSINHDKGAYKFKIYLTATMYHDFKQCLGINDFKHEISKQNNEVIQSINNDIEPKIKAKNSAIVVSNSVYNTMLSNLLVNVSVLNPIRLIKSNVNFEPPTEQPIKTDKDYITIEYPIGYIPPSRKKITNLDNKDIINYEPINNNATKLIVTAQGVLVEIPTNFKSMNKDNRVIDNKDIHFDNYYQKKTTIKTNKGDYIIYYHYWLTQTDKQLIKLCIENDFLSIHSKQKKIMPYKNNEFYIYGKYGKNYIKIPHSNLMPA